MMLDQHWKQHLGEDREQAMASLLAMTRAAPELRIFPHILNWTLPEAKRWVRLLQNGTESLTAARRAAALVELLRRSVSREAMAREARRHFDLVSPRDRIRMPALWARILLETEPEGLRAVLPKILNATRIATEPSRGHASLWLLDERIPEELQVLIRRWAAGLKDWELEPGVRLKFEAREVESAIKAGRTDEAALHLRQMIRWAPYCRYAGAQVDVIESAARIKVLREACLELVEIVLKSRSAQRPALLRLRTKLSRSPYPLTPTLSPSGRGGQRGLGEQGSQGGL